MNSPVPCLLLSITFTFILLSYASAQSIIQLPHPVFSSPRKARVDDALYCDSWRFSVETNDAGIWNSIPRRCVQSVQDYMEGDHYLSDSQVVSNFSLDFVNSVNVSNDGKDAWVFDIDETLLSNLPYYEAHGFGSEIFTEDSFNEWVELAEAPALPASLKLYNELKQLGVKIFLLTGRDEHQRNATVKNLLSSGYTGWEKLILRGPDDQGTLAVVYKSKKRQELVDEGYRIQGSSGDQWSDLQGYAVAKRSFKLPNPMYFIA